MSSNGVAHCWPNAWDPIRRLSEVRDRIRGSHRKELHACTVARALLEGRVRGGGDRGSGCTAIGLAVEEIPAYRRPPARFHGRLSQRFPVAFGMPKLEARKPGAPIRDVL